MAESGFSHYTECWFENRVSPVLVILNRYFMTVQKEFQKQLSDLQLFRLCKEYGAQALEARRKFAGLLPEVCRRRLYEKKGFSSIFEFAAKLAGMSHDQVRRVLQLEKRFEDKPDLKKALVKGEVSVNKLARVASIANSANQKDLVAKAKKLSQNALEVFVKDEKQNGSPKPLFDDKSVRAHRFELSEEVQEKLIKLREKGIDVNQLILEFLQKREEEIKIEKKTNCRANSTEK